MVFELHKSFVKDVALLQDHLRKFVLLSVHPQIGKRLLRRVQDFNQVVQWRGNWVVVKHAVGGREVLAVGPIRSFQK